MKKVLYRHQISKLFTCTLVVYLLLSYSILAQEENQDQNAVADTEVTTEPSDSGSGDVAKGKQLFNQNCA
ncbi:MAG: cytochrome C, partial [Eudoraea sp.]